MAEKIVEMPIEEILPTSFMEYAREVIEGRALPDVRDGLKPVHRRILYSMNELGITDKEPHRKSARIVGDVLGKYHPHGDTSVYDAMVRLAQDFSMRYPLVDGHGNFGSIDGDGAAAMRYTEARMKNVAVEMLKDIDKDTIEWQNNFDDTLKEPVCLPSFFPNLIVNGTSGIAVGMASSIPPHNLNETVDAINAYIKNPEIDTEGLMQHVKGPDFPTGGIVSPEGLYKAYDTGEGKVKVRAKVNIEELPNDKRQLVITEIPYQANKTKLKEKMADYIEARTIKDVVEVRDESDKDGIRIVIEMTKGGDAKKLLEELYAKTPLEDSFTYIMIALVNGKPRTLSLKGLIEEYVKHKKEVVEKRSRFQLAKAKKREHILLGLIKAVDIIDDIIKVIRHSKSPKEAKENLMKEFDFTGEQAQAILDLKLQRLTALEINELRKELGEIQNEISKLEKILSSEASILKEVQKELKAIKENYGDERRTLVADFSTLEIEESSEKFTLQIEGKKVIKRAENYRGEKGITLKSDSTQNILMFTKTGKILKYTGINLPTHVDDDIVNLCNKSDYGDGTYAIFITSDGQIKKTLLSEYFGIKTNSIALKLNENAHVVDVYFESDSGGEKGANGNNVVLFTKTGYVIRIKYDDIRSVGRVAGGIKAISLVQKDIVVSSIIINEDVNDLEINVEFTERDKSTQAVLKQKARAILKLRNVKIQNRGGKGTQLLKDLVVLSVVPAI